MYLSFALFGGCWMFTAVLFVLNAAAASGVVGPSDRDLACARRRRGRWLTSRPVGRFPKRDLFFSTHPKPADRGSRLDTSFFISHSRFGAPGPIFLLVLRRVLRSPIDPPRRGGRGGRRVERLPQASWKRPASSEYFARRNWQQLCAPEKKRGIRASLSDKSTVSGFSCPHANGAPWHRHVAAVYPRVCPNTISHRDGTIVISLFPSRAQPA